MSDLTDKELAEWTEDCAADCSCESSRALREIRRHRAAKRADAERVRRVVRDRVDCISIAYCIPGAVVDDLADRVAEQLASAVPSPDLASALRHLRESSERAPDVRYVPMRLVRQDAFDAVMEAAKGASAAPVLSAEDRRTFDRLRSSDGRTTAREREALDRLLGASR